MTLADAMRKGATMRPQGSHRYWSVEAGEVFASCAMGAAWDGLNGPWSPAGGDSTTEGEAAFIRAFFPLLHSTVTHPVWHTPAILIGVITNLNDTFRWTREQIADWLDTLPESTPSGGGRAGTTGLGAAE